MLERQVRHPGRGCAAAASASVSPTRPTSGVVNVAHGTFVGSKRNARTLASVDRAFDAATQPMRPAAWVNCRPPVTSPTAQMPSTRVAIVVVDDDRAARVDLDADLLEAEPSPRRCAADRHEQLGGGDRRGVVEVHEDAHGVAAVDALDPFDPCADSDVDAVCGKGLGDHRRRLRFLAGSSRSSASTSVTRVPSRAKAWDISQPIGPPPSTIIDSGRRLTSNSVSLVSGAESRRPGIGGTVGRAPVATTNRFDRIVRPSTSTVVGRGEPGEAVDDVDALGGEGSSVLGGGDPLDRPVNLCHRLVEARHRPRPRRAASSTGRIR